MGTTEQTNIPPKPFVAVAMAPVVIFALANALFLPLLVALDISRGDFWRAWSVQVATRSFKTLS